MGLFRQISIINLQKHLFKRVWKLLRSRPEKKADFLQESIELAMLELKAKAIRLEANAIIGLNIEYIVLGDFKKVD